MILLYALCHCMGRLRHRPVPAVYNREELPTYTDKRCPFIPSGRHGFLTAPAAASRTAVPNLTPLPHTVSIMPCPRGFRSPLWVAVKTFCSIIGSFLSFRHNVQLLLPGLNVYPSRFSENISRIPRRSVLSATEMPKRLYPIIGFMNFKDQSQAFARGHSALLFQNSKPKRLHPDIVFANRSNAGPRRLCPEIGLVNGRNVKRRCSPRQSILP